MKQMASKHSKLPSGPRFEGDGAAEPKPDEYKPTAGRHASSSLPWACPQCRVILSTRGTQEEAYAVYIEHFRAKHSNVAAPASTNLIGSAKNEPGQQVCNMTLKPIESRTALVDCPFCNAKVRHSRLQDHITNRCAGKRAAQLRRTEQANAWNLRMQQAKKAKRESPPDIRHQSSVICVALLIAVG